MTRSYPNTCIFLWVWFIKFALLFLFIFMNRKATSLLFHLPNQADKYTSSRFLLHFRPQYASLDEPHLSSATTQLNKSWQNQCWTQTQKWDKVPSTHDVRLSQWPSHRVVVFIDYVGAEHAPFDAFGTKMRPQKFSNPIRQATFTWPHNPNTHTYCSHVSHIVRITGTFALILMPLLLLLLCPPRCSGPRPTTNT